MEVKLPIQVHSWQFRRNCGTLGMGYLMNILRHSPLFDVSYHDDIHNVHRGERGTIVKCEGKEIYIDFWEYLAPTFMPKTINANFDLIIALQHIDITLKEFNEHCARKNVFNEYTDEEKQKFIGKIVPWTFFPSRLLSQYVGKENELWTEKIEREGFFCGKSWRCRHWIMQWLKKQDISISSSDQGEIDGSTITDEEYLQAMQTSRCGIVLGGRRSALTDAKNRREIDYMMLNKPLVLNYKPFYYNPLIAGVHYIYMDGTKDLSELLKEYDLREIANNGLEWYVNNASPIGAAKVFRQILQERLGI